MAACNRREASYHIEFEAVFVVRSCAPCLGGEGQVLMADGGHKLVKQIAVGDTLAIIEAPSGTAKHTATVRAVWRATVERPIPICTLSGVLITADHPVCMQVYQNAQYKRACACTCLLCRARGYCRGQLWRRSISTLTQSTTSRYPACLTLSCVHLTYA